MSRPTDSIDRTVRELIRELLESHFRSGQAFRPEGVVAEVVARFENGLDVSDESAAFWKHAGEKYVRSMVTRAVRRRHELQADTGQLPFPEFPEVQSHYDVIREAEWTIVPTVRLTLAEGRSKVDELRKKAATLTQHADQLELFLQKRYGR